MEIVCAYLSFFTSNTTWRISVEFGRGGEQQNLGGGYHFGGPYQSSTPSASHINARGLHRIYNFGVPDYDVV